MKKKALISVSDKAGLAPFVKELVQDHDYQIYSTGGTSRLLREEGVEVTDVSELTGFPEIMEGRVKTLHPKVHGGLLCRRDKKEHLYQAEEQGIALIDLVVVNLYPFEETVAKPGVEEEDAIENIDIGGPSMLRSAAKNFASVTVICEASDYEEFLQSLREKGADGSLAFRRRLARKVYRRTSEYDRAIADYLEKTESDEPDLESISGFPKIFRTEAHLAEKLRYGENPHQQAALYGDFFEAFNQLQGKALSFNNIIDISAAAFLIGEFEKPTVGILKHTNPCGVASDMDLNTAWEKAFATDRQAPFGGIIVINRTVTGELAEMIGKIFCEVIIAPDFSPEAREVFGKKKNLRLIVAQAGLRADALKDIRSIAGGLLVQDRDQKRLQPSHCKVVTERQPTEEEWASLLFGWKIVKHVKSNAIVYAGGESTLGIGAGQMSRVDSSRIAVWKAGEAGLSLKGSAIASDAFFPFADGLAAAADAGATAAIQPGGSVRDDEVIAEANKRGMTMVFTGVRHFRH